MNRLCFAVIFLCSSAISQNGDLSFEDPTTSALKLDSYFQEQLLIEQSRLADAAEESLTEETKQLEIIQRKLETDVFFQEQILVGQDRLANAAEDSLVGEAEQLVVSDRSLILNAVGLLILALALFFNWKSTKAATASANAAQRANQISEQTAHKQLRAYVTAGSSLFYRIIDPQGNITGVAFRAHWQNSGTTPAIDVRLRLECEVDYQGTLKVFDLNDALREENPANLGPGREMGNRVEVPINALADCVNNRATFYIYSIVSYADIYGNKYVNQSTRKAVFDFRIDEFPDDSRLSGAISLTYIGHQNGEIIVEEEN